MLKAGNVWSFFKGAAGVLWRDPSLALRAGRSLLRHRDLQLLIRTTRAYLQRKNQHAWLPGNRVSLDATASRDIGRRLSRLGEGKLISIVVPIYNTPEPLLLACVKSVVDQAYENWELILVDDKSPSSNIAGLLKEIQAWDSRIAVISQSVNGGISKATSAGLHVANGDYVAFLDHDDELTSDALLSVAESVFEQPEIDAWYSDQLKCDETGQVIDHFYKPDWSPAYLLGVMYIGHLLVVKTALAREIEFDPQFDGVQDFEFMLRLSERTSRVSHIPRALYKWRAVAGSLATGTSEKPNISELQENAVQSHLDRIGRPWIAKSNPKLPHRMRLLPSANLTPRPTSIIIPTRDQGPLVSRCLDSIFAAKTSAEFEVIVVDNQTTDPTALDAFDRHPIRHVPFDRRFNFSAANNLGVSVSRYDHLLFLNNDTEILEDGWLEKMSLYFDDPGVGCVGPVLQYPDGTVQHAGVVLGTRGTADHAMRHFPVDIDGYAGSLACAREVSAVTAACLMAPKRLFEKVGGFSADYDKHYQDVDLCLRFGTLGYRVLCVPSPRIIHYEGATRKVDGYDFGDRAIFIDKWHDQIRKGDPYYNRALDLNRLDYSPAAS